MLRYAPVLPPDELTRLKAALGLIPFVDLFSGCGGSSRGLEKAGYRLLLGINHDPVAVSTHRANHPHAEHQCEDIHTYDKRNLPCAQVYWASILCTEASKAGGRKRYRGQQRLSLTGKDEGAKAATFVQTRASALDVLAVTELHQPAAVLVENVAEFATDWELFDCWLGGVDDCTLHMLSVPELKQVQRFPADYIILGNQTEAILQIGNAVSVNAARWLGERLLPSLALAA